MQYADSPVIQAAGSLGSAAPSLDTRAGVRSLRVADPGLYPVGSFVYVASQDTVPGSADKLAYLRLVAASTGSTISVDKPWPRTLNSSFVRPVRLLPRIRLVGGGQIRHIDSSNKRELVNLTLCYQPVVQIELGPSGGEGVRFAHCFGGEFNGYVHDLRDDPANGHFGYGINAAGSTRNLYVRGRGFRCRHAFTTNVGPNIPNSAYYGEPEDSYVNMATGGCTNKALDTHRVGWGIVFMVNDEAGIGGSVQIRADNTTIAGGTINGVRAYGVGVSSLIKVPAKISNLTIKNVTGTPGFGLELLGPAVVDNVSLTGFTSAAIRIRANGCKLNAPLIDGVTNNNIATGIEVLGNSTTISNAVISRVKTGIKVGSGTVSNVLTNTKFGPGLTTKVLTL
jgi:hypothetical protein